MAAKKISVCLSQFAPGHQVFFFAAKKTTFFPTNWQKIEMFDFMLSFFFVKSYHYLMRPLLTPLTPNADTSCLEHAIKQC